MVHIVFTLPYAVTQVKSFIADYKAHRALRHTLDFGDDDMVYVPNVNHSLNKLQEQAGGKLLTDLNKPPELTVKSFSETVIKSTIENGNYVHFDLTYADDIYGMLTGTGQYANTVTAHELRYIQFNWSDLSHGVRFYLDGWEVSAPWLR